MRESEHNTISAGRETAASRPILIASYPKSGNTWMRALLSNYLSEDGAPVSINALLGLERPSRHRFDERLGLSSSTMSDAEILLRRPRLYELMAADAEPPVFVKAHEPWLRLPDGAPLFSPATFAGVIYLVRNPLDVAVSYAHHRQTDIDSTVKHMGDPRADLAGKRSGISHLLPFPISTWSRNVSSWLGQQELPTKVVSYESLHADPAAVFESVAAFAGLPPEPARLAKAVENSRFRRLREQEKRDRFREGPWNAPSFFRKGGTGDWRGVLSREQARRLVDDHGPAMAELGYLDEAERFLASD